MTNTTGKEANLTRRLLLPGTIAVGVLIAIAIVKSQPPMEHTNAMEVAKPVLTTPVLQQAIKPTIYGYGVIEPDVLLDAKSEISGRVIYVHPDLRKGAILSEGTVAVKIDSKDYELALRQAEANLAISQANLEELALNRKDVDHKLKLANEKLKLAEKELARLERLLAKGSISQSNVDTQHSQTLNLEQEVQNLTHQQAVLPTQKAVLDAQIAVSQANVDTQRRNLERTEIRVPFNARIDASSVENNQFIPQGTSLFKAQTLDRVIVNAQFPMDKFSALARSFRLAGRPIGEVTIQQGSENLFKQLDLEATLTIAGNGGEAWKANVEQISNSLDPNSRTLGVLLSVDHPYRDIKPGVRPPLLQGMYVEVGLSGAATDYLVVPRDALHEGELFIAKDIASNDSKTVSERETRLERVAAKPDHEQQGLALFETKADQPNRWPFAAGDQIITSDLFPAISGMKLQPSEVAQPASGAPKS